MPGFVDVSNMSDLEIKRLGQMDEEDDPRDNPYAHRNLARRNPYAYRKSSYVKKPSFSYEADNVWGAAVVAFRANKGYVKAITPDVQAHQTNRQLMEQLLQDNVPLSEADIEEGRKMRRYFQTLTFKLIEGKQLSPFLQQAMELSNKDKITDNLGVGTIASLPATYTKMSERDDVTRRIKWAQGGFVGQVGDKTKQTIEVVKQMWSQNWNTYYITGINDQDQVLFFAYKNNIEIGDCVTIEGKVKSHRDNSTQLSHVKVIK